jgi:septal ring factor EnvC (AmiA/AmiB activator)
MMLNKWYGWVMLDVGCDRPHVLNKKLQKISSSLKSTRDQMRETNARFRAVNEKIQSNKSRLNALSQEILQTGDKFNRLRQIQKFNLLGRELSLGDIKEARPDVTIH